MRRFSAKNQKKQFILNRICHYSSQFSTNNHKSSITDQTNPFPISAGSMGERPLVKGLKTGRVSNSNL
jgi:hypothetical protein